MTFRLLLIALIYYVFPVNATAADAAGILKNAEAKAMAASTLSADFTLSIRWELRDTTENKKGKLYFKKPETYRVELGDNLILCDGKTLRRHTPALRQYTISPLRGAEADFQPGAWFFRYTDRFKPVALDSADGKGGRVYGILLEPLGDEKRYDRFKVFISATTGLPRAIETTDRSGNAARYEITKIVLNKRLGDKLFIFKPPRGTEVIDLRD